MLRGHHYTAVLRHYADGIAISLGCQTFLCKVTHGPLAAFKGAGLAVLRDQSGDLLPGLSADLHEHTNHDPLMRPGEGQIPESDEGFLHPFITGSGAT